MKLKLGIRSKLLRGNPIQLLKQNLKSKKYLNVGCGKNLHKDFINLDYSWNPGLDLCWNISQGIPLEDNSLLGIFTEHCLEHIDYLDVYQILLNFRRMLNPGGNIRIVVPDAEMYLDTYQKLKLGERVNFPSGWGIPSGMTPMIHINRVFRAHGHLFAYDYITLKNMLEYAGFVDIQKESFMSGRDRTLLIDSKNRADESLYVEASVPNEVVKPSIDDAETLSILGIGHFALGKTEQAIEDFTQALHLNNDLPKVYYDRGMIHKIKGNAQLAIEDLQKAAALFSAQVNMEYFQQVQDIINELQQ